MRIFLTEGSSGERSSATKLFFILENTSDVMHLVTVQVLFSIALALNSGFMICCDRPATVRIPETKFNPTQLIGNIYAFALAQRSRE